MTAVANPRTRVVIVGAGIAGLVASARLAAAGYDVEVVERNGWAGGKMRALASPAGPVDAGPTVLTMRRVFEEVFASLGERLEDHIELIRQPVLARHFWPDGSRLDLTDDTAENVRAIRDFAGPRAAAEFLAFGDRARRLFDAFETPVMQAARPSLPGILRALARSPGLVGDMAPLASFARSLARQFSDPRLAQLFGRYATYVGGSPYQSPALLALIWQAEAPGVWSVRGGMHRLAAAVAALAVSRGARFRFDTEVAAIDTGPSGVTGVRLAGGSRIDADAVLFNGDPRALATGALGAGCAVVARQTKSAPRSLSADVWAFAARATGPALAHHNVFFRDDPQEEFAALARGRRCDRPTLYVCAMDRAAGSPPPLERFEIIANAPPLTRNPAPERVNSCRTRIFGTLSTFGLTFDPAPPPEALTTPQAFDSLFPHTGGALYGQSPHGLTAAFRRPTARTAIPGLYLAGGGAHPGAGVPMATLSGRHAAEAIMRDRTSTSPSRRTAMPGGTSTVSPPAAPAPSASSPS